MIAPTRIYLDHAAATPLSPVAASAMRAAEDAHFGNPGALHAEGLQAKAALETSRDQIAGALGVHGDEIVLTSGGTESVNLALRGALTAWREALGSDARPHIIVSEIEHPAVLETARSLEREGARLSVLAIGADGIVPPDTLAAALSPETVIVSLMYANNEAGMIQPIREYARVIRKWKKDHYHLDRSRPESPSERYPLLHTDACQAAGYLELDLRALGVDLLTLNAGKIGGPKGIGALFVRRGVPVAAVSTGGGQEGGRRSGTEAVPLVAGFAAALLEARGIAEEESLRLAGLRDRMEQEILARIPGASVNGAEAPRVPHILNVTIPDADHEMLVIALDRSGVACSTKSACSEREGDVSHVITALRRAHESAVVPEGLRFSLGRTTREEDVLSAAAMLEDCVKRFVEPVKGLVS